MNVIDKEHCELKDMSISRAHNKKIILIYFNLCNGMSYCIELILRNIMTERNIHYLINPHFTHPPAIHFLFRNTFL